MVYPLDKPSDKADRPQSAVPYGLRQNAVSAAPRSLVRSLSYEPRSASRIHPPFASNAIRVRLNQRFLIYTWI
jgi:hypothetical protein